MTAAPRTAAGLWDLMAREGLNPTGPRPKEPKKRDNTESRAQQALIAWWDANYAQFNCPKCVLFAVGNGGARSAVTGAIMKREGVRAGTSDLLLLVPRGKYHGMALEMKAPSGVLSREQMAFMDAMTDQGYPARVCYSVGSAVEEITNYLKLRPRNERTQFYG